MKFDQTRFRVPPGRSGKRVTLEIANYFLSVNRGVTQNAIFDDLVPKLTPRDRKLAPVTIVVFELGGLLKRMRHAGILHRELKTVPGGTHKQFFYYRTELGRHELPAIIKTMRDGLGIDQGLGRPREGLT